MQPTSAYSDVDRVTSSILYKTPLAPHTYAAHPQAAMLQQAGLIGAIPAMGINDSFWPSHLQNSLPVLQASSAPQVDIGGAACCPAVPFALALACAAACLTEMQGRPRGSALGSGSLPTQLLWQSLIALTES